MNKRPVIFLAFANDKEDESQYLRNLTTERNLIRAALKKISSGNKPNCEVLVETDVTINKIWEIFNDEAYRNRIAIFHYGGHAESYSLLLEDAQGHNDIVNANGLVSFLSKQSSLKLIFLNGCCTQYQAEKLNNKGVPAVIGTTKEIPDALAAQVANRFYSDLGNGLNIENAWNSTKDYIYTTDNKIVRGAIFSWESENYSQFSWEIYYQSNSKFIKEWSIPKAAKNPLFGLPEINDTYYLKLPDSPYLGLKRFEKEHAAIFFGRNSEIRGIYEKVKSIYPLIVLHGQSGVGKSSLLNAGLIPRFESKYILISKRRNQELGLLGTLKKGLKEYAIQLGWKENEEHFQESGEIDALFLWKKIEKHTSKPIIFILDQVEEYQTKPSPKLKDEEWKEFLLELKPLSQHLYETKNGKLFLSFRSEYFSKIRYYLDSKGVPYIDQIILPLTRQGVLESMMGVTKNELTLSKYKLSIIASEKEGFPEIVANELCADPNSPIAPMLQILLEKLWKDADENIKGERIIKVDSYLKAKEEGLGLNDFLNVQFQNLIALNHDSSSKLYKKNVERSGLTLNVLRHFITPQVTSGSVNYNLLLNLYDKKRETVVDLITQLLENRILVEDLTKKSKHITLSHDVLAPKILEFYDRSDRPGQLAKILFEAKQVDKNTNKYFTKSELQIVSAGKNGMQDLSKDQQNLISKSKQRRWFRILTNLSVFLIIASLVLFLFEIDTRDRANTLAKDAESIFENEPERGLNLAIKAFKLDANPITTSVLNKMWDESKFCKTRFEGHRNYIHTIEISPDSKYILTGSADSTARLWDTAGKEIRRFRGHGGSVKGAKFSRDGTEIATGSADSTAILWNIYGDIIQKFVGHESDVTSIDICPDKSCVVTGSWDNTVRIWDRNGIQKNIFGTTGKNSDKSITTVSLSQDGNLVLFGNVGGEVEIRTLDGRQFLGPLKIGESVVEYVDFADTGDLFLSTAGNSVKVWSLDGELVDSIYHEQIMTAKFSKDRKSIVMGGADKNIKVLNLKNGLVKNFVRNSGLDKKFTNNARIFDVDIDPNGEFIVSGDTEKYAKLWPLKSLFYKSFKSELNYKWPNRPYISSVGFSKDNKTIFTSGVDGVVRTWNLDGEVLDSFVGHDELIYQVEFSPDENFLLSGSRDKKAILWSRMDGTKKILKHDNDVYGVQFLTNEKLCITGAGRKVYSWNMNGEKVDSFTCSTKAKLTSLAVSKDDYIATGTRSGSLVLWDKNGKEIKIFGNQGSLINFIQFSPDGKYFLVSNQNGSAKLFSVTGNEDLDFNKNWTDSRFAMEKAIFSPDGKYILTASRVMKLWTFDGQLIRVFDNNIGHIYSAAFSSDGKYILAGGDNGRVRIWLRMDHIHDFGFSKLPEEDMKKYNLKNWRDFFN